MSDQSQADPSRAQRPLTALLDLLGRRWAPRVIWELRERPLTLRALRAACDEISPTVLHKRLAELRAAGFVEHTAGQGYQLTSLGAELLDASGPLYAFAERWAEKKAP